MLILQYKYGFEGVFESHPLRHEMNPIRFRHWRIDNEFPCGPAQAGPVKTCNTHVWASGEMSELAEGARLEIACTATKWYRGFESLSLRHQ